MKTRQPATGPPSLTSRFCLSFGAVTPKRPAAAAADTRHPMRRHILAFMLATCVANGCSETPTTPTPATATGSTDTFSSILNVGGTATRTFTVAVRGTVEANLAATAPQNIQVGFMVGVPRANGNGCLANVALATEASGTPQISVVADPGTFCVQVYDVGTLQAPLSFTVTVSHP